MDGSDHWQYQPSTRTWVRLGHYVATGSDGGGGGSGDCGAMTVSWRFLH
jgi:hypothetical protein